MSDKISQAIRSSSNYCRLPNGTLIQWTRGTLEAGQWMVNIGLPVSFNDNDFAASVTPVMEGDRIPLGILHSSTTNTLIVYTNGVTQATLFDVIAVGQWK